MNPGPLGTADPMTELTALVLACTLKPSPEPSSSVQLAQEFLDALREHDVDGSVVRVADFPVKFGVSVDEGRGDAWPAIREHMLDADILVLSTPIWLGQPSSVCKMVLERLDAELSETDDEGRMQTYGKVAAVAVVGNEDGAHHVTAECLQALNDTGFSIAANGSTYWVGEAMHTTDYRDLPEGSEKTSSTTKTAAANTAHLARLLQESEFPAAS